MKPTAAFAGLWFFGTIIFVFVIFGSYFKDASVGETIAWLVFIGFVVAGAAFCKQRYDYEQEERRKALNRDDSGKTQ